MNSQNSIIQTISVPALLTALLVSIPLAASQFTNEVDWSTGDYIFAAILLFGTGLTYKLVTGKAGSTVYRVAVGFALASGLFLIWSNLAVGIVGSEDNLFNLFYFVLPIAGIIGAIIVRFESHGLATTMFAVTFIQLLLTIAALVSGMQQLPGSSVSEILGVNGFFILLFLASAMLFRYAAQMQPSPDTNREN